MTFQIAKSLGILIAGQEEIERITVYLGIKREKIFEPGMIALRGAAQELQRTPFSRYRRSIASRVSFFMPLDQEEEEVSV